MIFTANVGFYDRDVVDHYNTYSQMCEHGEIVETKNAKYLRWEVGENLELWTRVKGGVPEALFHTYYAGDARMTVALLEKTPRSEETISDGAFLCRSSASAGAGWLAGCLPFVFDTPYFHRYDDLQLPRLAVVQLAAFALDMRGFEDEDEYDEANPANEEGYRWDYKHFFPSCVLNPRGEDNELQLAGTEVSGYVLDSGIITNPVTGLDFCWAKVETIGGEVDVVCPPDKLSGYLVKDGIATTNCYLYGRLIEDRSN
ncbi:MAG: hypothetical protein DMF65_08650 [Acidobacteria bacterium]|nr:MAG: hypothetical protein DMF65_08650 [Acidobacteriota bacterium]